MACVNNNLKNWIRTFTSNVSLTFRNSYSNYLRSAENDFPFAANDAMNRSQTMNRYWRDQPSYITNSTPIVDSNGFPVVYNLVKYETIEFTDTNGYPFSKDVSIMVDLEKSVVDTEIVDQNGFVV